VEHLFDSAGRWVAYRVAARWVWSRDGEWIGWCPTPADPDLVVDLDGAYLGHVIDDRLLRRATAPKQAFAGYPQNPGYPGSPAEPPAQRAIRLPPDVEDVRMSSARVR
jgi:hypothetical protein